LTNIFLLETGGRCQEKKEDVVLFSSFGFVHPCVSLIAGKCGSRVAKKSG